MKTQISRLPEVLHAPWSGVYQQQGRMLTDADWNAQAEVTKAALTDALMDAIGSGTPDRGGAVVANGSGGFDLVLGTVYAEGVRGELRAEPPQPAGAPFAFATQADFPGTPAQPETRHLLYVDLWERPVIAIEDAVLLDPGLHGADTTTRTRLMAQVKWAPDGFDPEDPAQNPPIGGARVTVTLQGDLTATDPCEPCADEIELPDRVGSYLFRVEVHDVGYDAAGAPNRVVLKWSRENGAEAAAIGAEPPGFIASNWIYDFFHGAPNRAESESHLGYHHPDVLATDWTPTRSQLVEGFPDAPPPGFALVRRWDGYVELEKSGADWRVVTDTIEGDPVPRGVDRGQRLSPLRAANEHGHVAEGPTVLLGLDTVALQIELADHPLLAGDYWHVAVREAVHASGDEILTAAAPTGIRHHYMALAVVDGETVTPLGGGACRRHRFPRLTDLTAEDVCYDNAACEMPGVATVQDALDHLCRSRDLRWHNKHLHGWGIVCGLIVECGPPDEQEEVQVRRNVQLTKGYALTCEGDDIVVPTTRVVDLIARVDAHDDDAETPILEDGNGTACLVLDLVEGEPQVRVEPHDPAEDGILAGLLDGTLLGDVIQHCVLDLLEAVRKELSFVSGDDLDALEDDADEPLISLQRKKFTAVVNLAIQLINRANGSYVFLSPREHLILRDLYLNLRELLQSRTFCGMFRGDDFPSYPFQGTNIDTWFGKNSHTRILRDPTGSRVYTWGGGDATINVYNVEKRALVEIVEMPAAEGAEVTALALSANGRLLYAAASVRGQDTILAIAQTGDTHVWEMGSIVLCDLTIAEMQVDADDDGLIYAVGTGRGVFYLRPKLLREEATPKPDPVYPFRAVGHMAIDPRTRRIFATSASGESDTTEVYNQIRLMPMAAPESPVSPPAIPILDVEKRARQGRDGLALRPADNARSATRVYLAVDAQAQGEDKDILTLEVPVELPDVISASAQLAVEDTQIALAHHAPSDQLLATFEDSYRLMTVTPDGLKVVDHRIPVQIQPTDLSVGAKGEVYVLNFLSNTVTAIPAAELAVPAGMLEQLANYRHEILLAFYALVGGLAQYLKDCFCHHLMVKCPECDGSEKIYLACVEIRDREVYNICNFSKRRYVMSFPTVEYWLSLIPIAPLIQRAVAAFCCQILPNLFDRYRETVAPPPPPPQEGAMTGSSKVFRATTTRNAVRSYKATDFNAIRREQTGGLMLYGKMATDVATNVVGPTRVGVEGLKKQAMLNAPAGDARRELERAGVKVAAIEPYDPTKADRYIVEYARTPGRLAPGSEVVIYERDGKAVFFAEKRAAPAVAIDPDVEARIAQLEARKSRLADVAETQRELNELQARKAGFDTEIGVLRGQIEALKAERAAEERRIDELVRTRDGLKTDLDGLHDRLARLAETQKNLKRWIDRERPVSELQGVTPELSEALTRAGVRTVGDLAAADAASLRQAGVTRNTRAANALIEEAKQRLDLTEEEG